MASDPSEKINSEWKIIDQRFTDFSKAVLFADQRAEDILEESVKKFPSKDLFFRSKQFAPLLIQEGRERIRKYASLRNLTPTLEGQFKARKDIEDILVLMETAKKLLEK